MSKLIKYLPLLLLSIVVASICLYTFDWWAKVYPYVIQLYPALILGGMLYYAVRCHHPVYLRVLYIGLIDINILNCITEYFQVEDWMPYTVVLIFITLTLVAYFLIRKRNVSNKSPTITK